MQYRIVSARTWSNPPENLRRTIRWLKDGFYHTTRLGPIAIVWPY